MRSSSAFAAGDLLLVTASVYATRKVGTVTLADAPARRLGVGDAADALEPHRATTMAHAFAADGFYQVGSSAIGQLEELESLVLDRDRVVESAASATAASTTRLGSAVTRKRVCP